MKKRVVCLGGLASDDGPQTDYATGFAQLMPEHDFIEVRFDNLVFSIKPDSFSIVDHTSGEELSNFDLIIFRGKIRKANQLAYITSIYCKLNNLPFFNDYINYRPSSKLAQAVFFYQQKVPFIDTYYSLNCDHLKKAINDSLDYPFILKDNFGSHGNNNHLVKDKAQLAEVLSDNTVEYLAQPFHPNEGDYRVLVMAELEPLQILRTSVGDSHLNNTSQGGTSQLVNNLPAELVNDSKRLAHNLNMTVAGVDLLINSKSNQAYFLEINSQPQLLSGSCTKEKAKLLEELISSLLKV